MPLPFVVPKSFIKTHTIKDETGITLEIPKYGSLTWAEYMFWAEEALALGQSEKRSMADYTETLVSNLLKLRFNLPPETTTAEVLSTPNGEPLPETMVSAIFEFFTNEQQRWKKPEPVSDGEEKKEVAEK